MTSRKEEAGSARGSLDLSPDPMVGAFRSQSGESAAKGEYDRPVPVQFAGLIGEDDGPERVRVYLDYEMRTYVVVNQRDVLHRERTKNPAGADVSILFVRKDAVVTIRELSSEEVQADALSEALIAAESGAFPSAAGSALGPGTIIIATSLICTKIFCTNATCSCTSRHSLVCSIVCSRHIACPNPWTKNWFCVGSA